MTTPAPSHLPATLSSTDVSVLAPQQLEALGLEASDQADVLALADGLDWSQRDALMRFGRDAAQKSAEKTIVEQRFAGQVANVPARSQADRHRIEKALMIGHE